MSRNMFYIEISWHVIDFYSAFFLQDEHLNGIGEVLLRRKHDVDSVLWNVLHYIEGGSIRRKRSKDDHYDDVNDTLW